MGRKFMIRAGCAAWCVAAAVAGLPGQQPVVAHVLDIKGEWHLQGSAAPVAAGAGLTAGAAIVAGSNRLGDAITIVRDADMSRQHIACDSTATNPCRNPIVVEEPPSATAAQSQLKTIVETALGLLLSKPPAIASHYALTLSRGAETVQEWEGVAALDSANGVALPPPPADMPAAKYTVSITKTGDSGTATEQTLMLTSDGLWRPLALKAAGLYEISFTSSDGDQVADELLLVVPADRYDAARAKFDATKARTAEWTGPSARTDEHLFLRAFLLSGCTAC
jgi:hypothetical protein